MKKLRIATVLAASLLAVSVPLVSHADDSVPLDAPQEVPTHGNICVTYTGWPYPHVCVL